MAKKKTTASKTTKKVKKKAAQAEGTKVRYEKIVPIPHINVYSELPFQLIELREELIATKTPDDEKLQTAGHTASSLDRKSDTKKKRRPSK